MSVYLKQTIAVALAVIGYIQFGSSSSAASLVLDSEFRPPLFAEPAPAQRVEVLPDGRFLIFWNTDTVTDQRTGAITRYLANGALDTSFNFSGDYRFVGAVAPTSNDQLIISAIGYTYGTVFGSEQILRLNSDGSIDSSFHASVVHSFANQTVRSILVQSDNKILVVGSLYEFAGSPVSAIVRLLADGTVDPTFVPPQFVNESYGIYPKPIILSDGKILVAGSFSQINGVAVLQVARLNSDGSVDPSFFASGYVRATSSSVTRGLAVQADGKILIAGRYRVGSGPPALRLPLIRLNADGSLDNTYLPTGFGSADTGRDVVLQPDGKALAGIASSVYRFDSSAAIDATFASPYLVDTTFYSPGEPGYPTKLHLHSNGQITVGGYFTEVNPSGTPDNSHFNVARLNSDGTLDPTFATTHKTGVEDHPSGFERQTDGSTLVTFQPQGIKHDPPMNFNVGRLLPDGSIDSSFTLSSSDPSGILSMDFFAKGLTRLLDGDFFVFGSTLDGDSLLFGSTQCGKFHADGSQDLGFQFDPNVVPPFQQATLHPSGKVLLAAGDDAQATVIASMSSVRRNGALATAFLYPNWLGFPFSPLGQIVRDDFDSSLYQIYVGNYVLAVQPDGKPLFTYYSSDQLFHFVRMTPDGSIDTTFNAVTLGPIDPYYDYPVVFDPANGSLLQPPGGALHATPPLQDAHVLTDGRILVCGQFTTYNGSPSRGIVRLNPDGTVDNTFNIGGGAQWTKTTETADFFPAVEAIEEQVDGKLLIAGTFEAFNGIALPGIASLNPDGSVDPSFVPPVKRLRSANGRAHLSRQPDGSFLLSGPYSFLNENHPSFIRLQNVGGIPLVGSSLNATALVDVPFTYQTEASGQPTSYDATGLPSGFAIDPGTGLITGTAQSAEVGIYDVSLTATNQEGTSNPFHLTLSVVPSQAGPSPRLQNISTRLKVLSADNALIGGFIINGFGQRRVIIRAIGPSLTAAGISGALVDPVLELHGPNDFVTITNDNWRDTQQTEIEASGIAPTNDAESAIVATLDPGAYTAIVRGKNDSIGIGLVEAYDLDSTAYAEFSNIGPRGFVDAGLNVMIGGVIAGPSNSGSGQALIRAIGPSLTALGVPNALPNPRLELHDSNGGLIASNHNWRDTQGVAIAATGIAPTDDNEAAILLVLSPGSYTAVVAGEDEGTGVGLVEVYNLD